jgi:hypothetical protein
MTLVVAAAGNKSIWLMTDRRITYTDPRKEPRDDARKVLQLHTPDGVALLGYAGLGETPGGTEPSDWMSRVLRGRKLPLEESLGVLTHAINCKLPDHLTRLPGSGHYTVVPAFRNGESRIYLIGLIRPRGSNRYNFQYNRLVGYERRQPQPFVVTGSGEPHVLRDRPRLRHLLRLIRAHDAGRITPPTVAREFAKLNHEVSRTETTVGRRCIVCWRFQSGGGAHQHFDGMQRELTGGLCLPSIAHGMDVGGLVKVTWQHMNLRLDPSGHATFEIDVEGRSAAIAKLPDAPDERLT